MISIKGGSTVRKVSSPLPYNVYNTKSHAMTQKFHSRKNVIARLTDLKNNDEIKRKIVLLPGYFWC